MIPHENADGSHNDAEHATMESFEGMVFDPVMPGLDLVACGYDSLVVVFIRGQGGKLQQLMWPMTLSRLPNSPVEAVQ